MWQAEHVAGLLKSAGLSVDILPVETSGDKKLEVSLAKIGEKGLFTKELETLLQEGKAHLAVHSAKDMASRLPDGLEIIAFTRRENPADVLVSFRSGAKITDAGIRIGTSSTRRVAMLRRYAPSADSVPVRGNLQTRFRKMQEGACDAMLLARAGVVRMGFDSFITEELPSVSFTPAAGQASLAVEVSQNLPMEIRIAIRDAVNHFPTENAVCAERSFLHRMEGGCSIPVFALCEPDPNGIFLLNAGIISPDGDEEIRFQVEIPAADSKNPEAFVLAGQKLASEVLGHGGASILQKIKLHFD